MKVLIVYAHPEPKSFGMDGDIHEKHHQLKKAYR